MWGKREHCFLAMFPKGGQTRKHCFLAMFPKGGQTRKHCFLVMFPKGGQTRKHCFLVMFLEGGQCGQTRKHCFLAMFTKSEQTRRHCFMIYISSMYVCPLQMWWQIRNFPCLYSVSNMATDTHKYASFKVWSYLLLFSSCIWQTKSIHHQNYVECFHYSSCVTIKLCSVANFFSRVGFIHLHRSKLRQSTFLICVTCAFFQNRMSLS